MKNAIKNKTTFIVILSILLALAVVGVVRGTKTTQPHDSTTSSKTTTVSVTNSLTETTTASLKIIPDNYVDYRSLIGKDYSVLDVDEFDPTESVHELGKGNLFGHEGTIFVDLAWDNKTIESFSFLVENLISSEETDTIYTQISEIFGKERHEQYGDLHFYGNGDFELVVGGAYKGYIDRYASIRIKILEEKKGLYIPPKPSTTSTSTSTTKTITRAYSPQIGMTPDQIRKSSWGPPSSINKTTTQNGIHEQWVYRGTSKTKYIYFDNGVVTAIQE